MSMALADERNTSLAFDTTTLRDCGSRYERIADELRTMAKRLNTCLFALKDGGWTTPAGSMFQKMTETNWEENIEKYADLLDTLKRILDNAADQYDGLVTDHIEQTKL